MTFECVCKINFFKQNNWYDPYESFKQNDDYIFLINNYLKNINLPLLLFLQ